MPSVSQKISLVKKSGPQHPLCLTFMLICSPLACLFWGRDFDSCEDDFPFVYFFQQKKTPTMLSGGSTSISCDCSVSRKRFTAFPSDSAAHPLFFPLFFLLLFFPPLVCSLCRTSGFQSVAIFKHIIMLVGSEYQQLSAAVSHTSGKHSLKLSS